MSLLHTDFSSPPPAIARTRAVTAPAWRFAAAALLGAWGVALLATWLMQGDTGATGGATVVYLAACAFVGYRIQMAYPHDALGWCNLVTLARMGMAAALIVPIIDPGASGWAVTALAVVALSLDGVDGWLARRQNLCSDFGARFDMEVDSALAALLALNALAAGQAGPLVLILGAPHYLFLVAGWMMPWMARPLPQRLGRKAGCVLQIAALIVVQVPAISPTLATLAVGIAVLALAWSFGRDIHWLWRRRAG
ncbi:CDP-alcohol phosphatidyltransferase family protein [Palleronia pelagia]|uniref:CDP-alcohol phosphatidyltransferase n=1 Tax=Palleronia pelagia TaxID=387096 RepID=A0A1H8DEN2_9RHOB|nr:CDP-alcohol phosphatidyltransferase family protein [Palleronia pelagia]SEN05732.1 CDP-alcohol phosphatidyltransferase [Palleronia pelagia]